jgi:HSP20 family protein
MVSTARHRAGRQPPFVERRIDMLLTRWKPFNPSVWSPFHQMQSELSRLVERWNDPALPLRAAEFPAINLWEDDDAFLVEAELPGFEMDDLEIFVANQNQLSIKGERKPLSDEKATPHRQERWHGTFVRTLTLPSPVDDARVEAKLDNGVLAVRLPKHEAAKPRRIAITS